MSDLRAEVSRFAASLGLGSGKKAKRKGGKSAKNQGRSRSGTPQRGYATGRGRDEARGRGRGRGRKRDVGERKSVRGKKSAPRMSSFIPPPASTSNGKSSILELDYEGTQKLAEEKWFETPEAALPSPPQGKGKTKGGQGKQTRGYINSLRARSKRALQASVDRFTEEKRKIQDSSERKWFSTVMSTGTLQDKVAALTLAVQESPIHSLPYLDRLLLMASKKAAREQSMGLEALKDLFLHTLLPDNRKLLDFEERVSRHCATYPKRKNNQRTEPSDGQVATWVFEEQIKERYVKFLEMLQRALNDPQEHVKRGGLNWCLELLCERPEAEQQILTIIVNKLGDLKKKVASQAVFTIHRTLQRHPGMKSNVIKEVERLLFRPNVSDRARYYGLITLNQMVFTESSICRKAAGELIEVYIALFKTLMGQDSGPKPATTKGKRSKKSKKFNKSAKATQLSTADAASPRMVSALLTGINRAAPYAPQEYRERLEEESDVLFTLAHTAPLPAATQALTVIFHMLPPADEDEDHNPTRKHPKGDRDKGEYSGADEDEKQYQEDAKGSGGSLTKRFYRALYAKLLALAEVSSGHRWLTLFLNLVYKALLRDENRPRLSAFARRLLQCCWLVSPHISCGILHLLTSVPKTRNAVRILLSAQSAGGKGQYDPNKREPVHCNAAGSGVFEPSLLNRHFHPAVRKFVEGLIGEGGQAKPYRGDPLVDFTNNAFLDRFVYRNPKEKKAMDRGIFARRKENETAKNIEPANTEGFVALPENQIAVHERFMHKFFKLKKKAENRGMDSDSESDPDEDEEIDQFEANEEDLDMDDKTPSDKESQDADEDIESINSDEIDAFADRLMEEELRKQVDGGSGSLMDPDIDDDDLAIEAYLERQEEGDIISDVEEGSENELYAERDEEAEREGGSGSEDDPEKGGRLEESNEPVPDAHTLDYTDSGDSSDEEAALREMEGRGDTLEEPDFDYDEESDPFFDALDTDDDVDDPKDSFGDDTFAAAEEYAQMLEDAAGTEGMQKQKVWEDQKRGDRKAHAQEKGRKRRAPQRKKVSSGKRRKR
ncbi:hypothetical protein AAMO2058_000858400 [Amorphochlora amoebiformis]